MTTSPTPLHKCVRALAGLAVVAAVALLRPSGSASKGIETLQDLSPAASWSRKTGPLDLELDRRAHKFVSSNEHLTSALAAVRAIGREAAALNAEVDRKGKPAAKANAGPRQKLSRSGYAHLGSTSMGDDDGLDPMVFRENQQGTLNPQDMAEASSSVQKKLVAQESKVLSKTVSDSLKRHGIQTPKPDPVDPYTVWGALSAVGHIFRNIDLDRAMSDTFHHAKRVFNMTDKSHCDPKCIHTCHCTYEPIPIPWTPPNVSATSGPHSRPESVPKPEPPPSKKVRKVVVVDDVPAPAPATNKWWPVVNLTVILYREDTAWTPESLQAALHYAAMPSAHGRGRSGEGAGEAGGDTPYFPPGTEYVKRASLLPEVRAQGLQLWGESSLGGAGGEADLRVMPDKSWISTLPEGGVYPGAPQQVVTAELQLTNFLDRDVSDSDIVALSYALAKVLHLSLSDVQVSVGAPVVPSSCSGSSLCPPPPPSPQPPEPTEANPAEPAPAPRVVEPLTELRCDGKPKPPPLPPTTAADREAMDAPPCRGVYDVSGTEGKISSGPPVPLTWEQGADCRWLIQAPAEVDSVTLDFEAFQVSGMHGHLRIYSGHKSAEEFKTSAKQDSGQAYKTYSDSNKPWQSLTIPTRTLLIAWRAEPCDLNAHFQIKWTTSCSNAPCSLDHALSPGMERALNQHPTLKVAATKSLQGVIKPQPRVQGTRKTSHGQASKGQDSNKDAEIAQLKGKLAQLKRQQAEAESASPDGHTGLPLSVLGGKRQQQALRLISEQHDALLRKIQHTNEHERIRVPHERLPDEAVARRLQKVSEQRDRTLKNLLDHSGTQSRGAKASHATVNVHSRDVGQSKVSSRSQKMKKFLGALQNIDRYSHGHF